MDIEQAQQVQRRNDFHQTEPVPAAIKTAQLRSSKKLRYRAQLDEFVFLIELVIGDRLYDHDWVKCRTIPFFQLYSSFRHEKPNDMEMSWVIRRPSHDYWKITAITLSLFF